MVNNWYVITEICRWQGQCISTVSVILKSVHFLLVMLSLLLEDTFHLFPFNRSNFKVTGSFCALHNSLMWKLFLKSGGELGDRSSQMGKKKWEKREIANTPQLRQMWHWISAPTFFLLDYFWRILTFDQIFLSFFPICWDINHSDFKTLISESLMGLFSLSVTFLGFCCCCCFVIWSLFIGRCHNFV